MGWALRPATVRNIALSADNCSVRKNRNRFVVSIQNHNHEMKEIFKGAATRASCGVGPLRDFYGALLGKGMKPEMARLTLARKIAAIAPSDNPKKP